MNIEQFPKRESELDRICAEKGAEGWHFMARENLTKVEFQEDAKFLEVPKQTEEDIREKYLKIAKENNSDTEFEVELVLDENTHTLKKMREISDDEEYKRMKEGLAPKDRTYLVFIRKIEG